MKLSIAFALLMTPMISLADIVPSAPTARGAGKLLLKGQISADEQAKVTIDLKGKKKVEAGNDVQRDVYTACLLGLDSDGSARTAGSGKCHYGRLNEALKVPAGPYLVDYAGMLAVIEVSSGATKTVELLKIRAPEVSGANWVQLEVDYTNRSEQNKFFFRQRVDSDNEAYLDGMATTRWGRENLDTYLRTGDQDAIGEGARRAYFSRQNGLCYVGNDGAVGDCAVTRVGAWSVNSQRCVTRLRRTVAVFPYAAGIEFPTIGDTKCEKVKYSWNRAYFLVLPGVYKMTWGLANGEKLEKTGIRAP